MKKIKKLIHSIKDEICSAEHYAEEYINHKIEGDNSIAERYKQFAQQEIEHATFIHSVTADYISKLSKVMTAPPDMTERWAEAHEDYVERVAEIKGLLNA